MTGTAPDDARGRLLFRYVTGEEWQEYRAIMGVLAGTFFSEFTPDEVAAQLAERGVSLEVGVVGERLESLRRWGNLTRSSVIGPTASLDDYYRRRNRYLVTRAGQEVHEVIERVLARVDEVRDISTGRLRALHAAVRELGRIDVAACDPVRLADLVRAVFDPHEAFTSEITVFSAGINQWQSRYDLSPEEFAFFAQVLVGYVSERLEEIERLTRQIATDLAVVLERAPAIVQRANRGLVARVEEAGLGGSVAVTRQAGSSTEDWDHLAGWFVTRPGRPARMVQLKGEAVAAVRVLLKNLTRLSRVGLGGSSRRADLLALAKMVDANPHLGAGRLVGAAFGLAPARHFGALSDDGESALGTAVSWWDAPPASVAVSLRERGDTTSRGRASPIADRSEEHRLIQHRRRLERAALQRVDGELLAHPQIDGRHVSSAALARFEALVAGTLSRMPVRAPAFEHDDGRVRCRVERVAGASTAVSAPEGTLTLGGLRVTLAATAAPAAGSAAAVLPARGTSVAMVP
jgi:uncharacterized protein (TIGR02677 family)